VETPPAPPRQDLISCDEKLGEFLVAKIPSLLEGTSGNSALGQGFSDLVHKKAVKLVVIALWDEVSVTLANVSLWKTLPLFLALNSCSKIGKSIFGKKMAENKVKITLHRGIFCGATGFEWDVELPDGELLTYRTNSQYAGLFLWDRKQLCWRQLLGTAQFSLPESRQAALRKLHKLHDRL